MQRMVCADAVDPDAKAMDKGGLKLPRARELARLVFGEDLEALAGGWPLRQLDFEVHREATCAPTHQLYMLAPHGS